MGRGVGLMQKHIITYIVSTVVLTQQHNAMRCDAMRFDSIQYNAIQCYAILTKTANKPPLWCLVRHVGTDRVGKKCRGKRETSSTVFAHTSFVLHPFLRAL